MTHQSLTYSGPVQDHIDLLVLQPSPFCNINCDYCYLSDQLIKRRLTHAFLETISAKTIGSGLVREKLSIVWHAGEPLSVPIEYYLEAFQIIAKHAAAAGVEVMHSMQTNATLI